MVDDSTMGLLHILTHRDCDDKYKSWLINEVTLKNTKPYYLTTVNGIKGYGKVY